MGAGPWSLGASVVHLQLDSLHINRDDEDVGMEESWQQREQRAREDFLRSVPPVEVTCQAPIIPPVSGQAGSAGAVLITASIGPADELVALWADGPDAITVTSQPASDPQRSGTVARLPALALSHPSVQPLPGDQFLIASARSRWHPDGADRNGRIYSADGRLVADGVLGDGIAQLQTTPSGAIWVGYFDEGVFGNHGWGGSGATPIGHSGLVRFAPDLSLAWEFPAGSPEDSISDCYALNLDGEVAWASYYIEFPLVRIEAGRVRSWANTAYGAKALAVSGHQVVFAGGYVPERDRLVPARFSDEYVQAGPTLRMVPPEGGELPPFTLIGRGARLHLLTHDTWYTLDLHDVPG